MARMNAKLNLIQIVRSAGPDSVTTETLVETFDSVMDAYLSMRNEYGVSAQHITHMRGDAAHQTPFFQGYAYRLELVREEAPKVVKAEKAAKLSPTMAAAMWEIKRGYWYLVPIRTMNALKARTMVQHEMQKVPVSSLYPTGLRGLMTFTPEGDIWIWNARGAAQAEAIDTDLAESNAATRRWVEKFNTAVSASP